MFQKCYKPTFNFAIWNILKFIIIQTCTTIIQYCTTLTDKYYTYVKLGLPAEVQTLTLFG